ncbi:MAG: 4-diphosphocytidyl-2C-methyl-D-erythritol kinase [Verrucomicrobia bacterium]|nr:4-diphosphocytidyl-2C-methyl-D-erythritol kinase [Verrucomicrobiota bacterium]
MAAREYFCPAKLNLFLAVTGRRADGYHDLVSVAAPLACGDTLAAEPASGFTLACDDPGVPVDGTNLVLKAAQAFRAATGWGGGAKFTLTKRIPMGAGLGGGSSDAASALRALNELAGFPLAAAALMEAAATVGSDCPLFLADGPAIIRGRGERIERLEETAAARLEGRRVMVFKPAFGISTPWAYGAIVAAAARVAGGGYLDAVEAESRVAEWVHAVGGGEAVDAKGFNSLEAPTFEKFLALPAMLSRLRNRFGLSARMSGSGSACFAFVTEDAPIAEISKEIRAGWGESAWIADTRLSAGFR